MQTKLRELRPLSVGVIVRNFVQGKLVDVDGLGRCCRYLAQLHQSLPYVTCQRPQFRDLTALRDGTRLS